MKLNLRPGRRSPWLAAGLLSLGLVATPPSAANAFSVTPNDTVDSWPNQPGLNGTLTIGPILNRAGGALTCIGFGCSDPFDSFRIEVPSGLRVTRTEFTSFGNSGPNTLHVLASDGVTLIDPLNDLVFPVNPSFTLSSNGGVLVSSSLVLGQGFHDVVIQRGAGGRWLVDFVTEAVAIPEPGAGILWTLGLSALVVKRRLAG